MKKTMTLVLVLALGLANMSLASEGRWTRKANMPTARSGLSTSVVDGKIYAIGGAKDLYVGPIPNVEEYDPATDTWTKKADMPGARYGHSAAVVSAKIYVIGGATAPHADVPTVQEYDPATDTWTKKANMPTARSWFSACAVNSRIYAIGGRTSGANFATVEEYDPATDTWTRKADMPAPRACLSASVVNGKIYAIGGGWYDFLSTVEEYDPATDTWTKKTDMPTARRTVSTSVVGDKIYAIGGGTVSEELFSTEEYDPSTDTWTKKADMPTARSFLYTSAVNGKIYAIGGISSYYGLPTGTVEEYDPNPLVVDFNGDGIVDAEDMCIMVDYWGTDDALCDIGPMPWGDGIVDVEDLKILAEHLFEEVNDPTLIAHWPLDETQGDIAYDSVSVCDGILIGNPVWQPKGGAINGALELDGTDDFVTTDFIINPAEGPFSVFVWIQGGAPGQTIVSQQDTANWAYWLMADAEGNLMTKLKSATRSAVPLMSQTIITDGYWHRVGFVWDGLYRSLYVDDILVAEDTQEGLGSSVGGLNIGTGKAMEAGTFWSGLIDDIRIYNRVVRP